MRDRVILHVDMDGFYAAVESLSHPEVLGRPMAVAGDPENRRGIILAKNQLAKQAGVKTAEPIWQAVQKCPGLILLPPHHRLYAEYCELANAVYERFTGRVERAGVDESYLDITGTSKPRGGGRAVADEIRNAIRTELKLTVSVGVSFCKVFAKLGSDLNKPDGTSVITRDNYRELLYPLPVRALMFVGKTTEKKLNAVGVYTLGQLAAMSEEAMNALLGKHGLLLYRYANGLDDEPVLCAGEQEDIKSVGNGMTFRRDLVSREDVRLGLRVLSESVAYRLRKHQKKCYGVQLSIKDPELKVIDRQAQLQNPTNLAKSIFETAMAILERSWKIGKPIRLLTVTAISLTDESDGGQMTLFDDGADTSRQEALERSLDMLKRRYGKSVVKPAAVLKNDLGIDE
ncbi:MAG: DNA polymerase IV [Oscillospiraceae bacterium]|jgi:DNA polymerase-4|nr:DNA polymerase IV [Oscillospiraceae bacterium]